MSSEAGLLLPERSLPRFAGLMLCLEEGDRSLWLERLPE